MVFLYIFLFLLLFILISCLFFLTALLHTRDGHPTMKELEGTVYAHRGLHDAQKPENSAAAFEAAVAHGFGIEFDLHLTSDGRLVVHHDGNTKRMCGVDLTINSASFDEVRALRLPDGSQIPSFEELLAIVGGRVPLLVELKNDGNNGAALVDAALEILRPYNGKYIVESFDPRVLYALKKTDPEIVRGQLCQDFPKSGDAPWYMRHFLASMVTNLWTKPDFVAYNIAHRTSLPLRLLDGAHKNICFWTVRNEEDFRYCISRRQSPIFEKIPPETAKRESAHADGKDE